MNRIITSITAATMVLGTLVPSAFAASATKGSAGVNYNNRVIQMGKYDQMVKGVAALDKGHYTEFLPLWYVIKGLQQLGYTASWNGTTKMFDITTPSGVTPNLTGVNAGAANAMQIVLNGTDVQNAPRVVAKDPYTGVMTTYVPIWYLNQALSTAGMQNSYDGTTWKLFATGNQSLSALSVTGATTGTGTQASPDTVNNGSALTLSTTLMNADGTPIGNTQVTFNVTGNTNSGVTAQDVNGNAIQNTGNTAAGQTFKYIAYTNASGVATIKLTDASGLTDGLAVQATAPYQVNGAALSSNTVQLEYVASGSAAISPLATGNHPVNEALGTSVPVVVTLPSVNGVVQSNVPVQFTVDTTDTIPSVTGTVYGVAGYLTNSVGANFGSVATAYTNSEGQATIWVNSAVAGEVYVKATSQGTQSLTESTFIQFGQAGVATSINNVVVSNTDATAGTNVTISGQVVDAQGNPVANTQLLLQGSYAPSNGDNSYVVAGKTTAFPNVNIAQGVAASTVNGLPITTDANGNFSVVVTDSAALTGDTPSYDAYTFWPVQNGVVSGNALPTNSSTDVSWQPGTGLAHITTYITAPSSVSSGDSTSITGIGASSSATSTVYFAPTSSSNALTSGSYTYTLSASNGGTIKAIDGAQLLNPVSSTNVTISNNGASGVNVSVQGGFASGNTPAVVNPKNPELFSVSATNSTTGNMVITAANGSISATDTVAVSAGNPTQLASVSPVSGIVNFGQATPVSFTVEDTNGDPVANRLVNISLASTVKPLWVTAINGVTLQSSLSAGTGNGNALYASPVPLYAPKFTPGYTSIGIAGTAVATGVGSINPTISAFTNSQGQITLTLQDGAVAYYTAANSSQVSTSQATGALNVGYTYVAPVAPSTVGTFNVVLGGASSSSGNYTFSGVLNLQ